ncbi:MAG TPA: response regulator transcription factor [Fibrella sp.]|jgi:DNA-binding NarL/FixJ family response regulator
MQPAPVSRILLIDDHRLFNDGVKSLLNAQTDLTVCGQVFQERDALPAIQRTAPHLILLDINLQGSNGIDLGHSILASYPDIRILIITMYNQPKLLDEARRVGLHGYLLKDVGTAELLRAIRTVLSGETSFDSRVNDLASPPDDPFNDSFAKRLNLTFREVEIIALIREGLSNEQIADRIHLSIETVKTHRKNIHFKLGISKATDLVRFAIEHGI